MKRTIYLCTLNNKDFTDKINVIITDVILAKYKAYINCHHIIPNSHKLTPLKDILIFMGDNT